MNEAYIGLQKIASGMKQRLSGYLPVMTIVRRALNRRATFQTARMQGSYGHNSFHL